MKQLVYSLLCLLFVSCNFPLREEHWLVGRFKISKEDSAYRSQIVQIFYPQNKIADAGLIQLKNAYAVATILENHGHQINDHKLSNESARIDASSRDPKTLEKIKHIFKKGAALDREAYFRVFVLPSYVERTLPSVFQELPLHAETLKMAQAFYATVIARPETFGSVAERSKFDFGNLCLSSAKGFAFSRKGESTEDQVKGNSLVDLSQVPNEGLRDSVMAAMSNSNEELVSKWFAEIVTPTNTGEIVSKIVDYYSSWLVLRLNIKSKDKACFEVAIFPKETLESWMEKERAKVTVKHVVP